MAETDEKKSLVIHIDGGLGRVVAMSGAITEVAKKRPVKVVTSRPLVFRGNPFIKSVHGLDDRRLFEDVIKGNDYIELEPYTDPKFFNEGVNRLEIAREKLGLEKIAEPILFLAEHEKLENVLQGCNPILFQPFGSSMQGNGADKSYRSIRVEDAQYLADGMTANGFTVYVVERDDQPKLQGCNQLTVQNMRWLVSLAERYPVFGCDSSMHHAAKAFNKKAVVIWSGTDAGRFGYDSSINLRESKSYTYVPFRLGVDFDLDIINQHNNKFSKGFLDEALKTVVDTFRPNQCNHVCKNGN